MCYSNGRWSSIRLFIGIFRWDPLKISQNVWIARWRFPFRHRATPQFSSRCLPQMGWRSSPSFVHLVVFGCHSWKRGFHESHGLRLNCSFQIMGKKRGFHPWFFGVQSENGWKIQSSWSCSIPFCWFVIAIGGGILVIWPFDLAGSRTPFVSLGSWEVSPGDPRITDPGPEYPKWSSGAFHNGGLPPSSLDGLFHGKSH